MENDTTTVYCTAFLGERLVATGVLEQVVSKVIDDIAKEQLSQILIFDDSTSKLIEVNFRDTKDVLLKRLAQHSDLNAVNSHLEDETPRPVGRPKLGVVAGEVTLLPRHWEWLKSQPGGASVTLRKMIDLARRVNEGQDTVRQAKESTYRFMTVMAGNRNHYEEALRALYAGNSIQFNDLMSGWPPDIHHHIKKLSAKAFLEIEENQ